MSVVIEFAKPAVTLNMNDRQHWRTKAKVTAAWKDAAYWAAKKQRVPTMSGLQLVTISLPTTSINQRRDPHNWYPTLKAVIDGLVMALVLFDDDSKHVVTSEPSFHAGGNTVRVTITELPA